MAVTQAVVPQCRQRKVEPIVNISSAATFKPLPLPLVYTASKAAIQVFIESLALELEQFNVRVRRVIPGRASTRFAENLTNAGWDPRRVRKHCAECLRKNGGVISGLLGACYRRSRMAGGDRAVVSDPHGCWCGSRGVGHIMNNRLFNLRIPLGKKRIFRFTDPLQFTPWLPARGKSVRKGCGRA